MQEFLYHRTIVIAILGGRSEHRVSLSNAVKRCSGSRDPPDCGARFSRVVGRLLDQGKTDQRVLSAGFSESEDERVNKSLNRSTYRRREAAELREYIFLLFCRGSRSRSPLRSRSKRSEDESQGRGSTHLRARRGMSLTFSR